MKQKFSVILFVGFICFGYGTLYADTLEKAIERQSNYIIRNSPRNTILAIVGIKSDSKLLSEYVMEKLPDYFSEGTQVKIHGCDVFYAQALFPV